MSGHEVVVVAIKRFWPHTDAAAVTADVRGLVDVPVKALLVAIEKYRQTDPHAAFCPTPSRLRELSGCPVLGAAEAAWQRRRLLQPIPVSSDIRWHDGRAQKIADEWALARRDPRFVAGLHAAENATAGPRRERAFLRAFQEAERELELQASTAKELA